MTTDRFATEFGAITIDRDNARLWLQGEIDLTVVDEVDDDAVEACGTAGRVAVDMSQVTFIDSSGMSLLLRLHNLAGGGVQIVGAPAVVQRLLTLTGMTALFTYAQS